MNDWLAALIGAVVGGALSRWTDRAKHSEALRAKAYADYLSAVAASSNLMTSDEAFASRRAVANAKAQIAVYGSTEVVRALARFEESGADLMKATSASAFVAVVAAMRPDIDAVAERDLSLLLLGRSS